MVRCPFAPLCTSHGRFLRPSRPRRRSSCVHRDIKPANIMIVADSEEGGWPFVKLIDFGLVRPVLPTHDSDHQRRRGLPTPRSPGVRSKSRRAIWTQGRIYTLLAARSAIYSQVNRPFAGSPTSDFAQQLRNEPPWACRVWNLLRGEAPSPGSVTGALTQQRPGGEPAWEKLEPFPRRIRHLLRRMLRKESLATSDQT